MKYYDDGEGPDDARELLGQHAESLPLERGEFAMAAAECEFNKDCHIEFPRDIFVVDDDGSIWCYRISVEMEPTFLVDTEDMVQEPGVTP